MYPNEVSNRMLYDLIIDQGQAINSLKQDIVRLEAKIGRLDEKIDRLEEKVDRLELKAEKVQIGFSRTMLAGNSVLAGVIAFIVAMFTGQYVVKLK